eukprot:gene55324-42557_t
MGNRFQWGHGLTGTGGLGICVVMSLVLSFCCYGAALFLRQTYHDPDGGFAGRLRDVRQQYNMTPAMEEELEGIGICDFEGTEGTVTLPYAPLVWVSITALANAVFLMAHRQSRGVLRLLSREFEPFLLVGFSLIGMQQGLTFFMCSWTMASFDALRVGKVLKLFV